MGEIVARCGEQEVKGPAAFQKRTSKYVIKRFWQDRDYAHRFLVADEVGLGKTMVARGVVEEALRRREGRPVDIVYLCSSQPVASQNLKRLKVEGHGGTIRASRLTLLALERRSEDGVRYFALTPDTSFKVSGSSGQVRERALIYWALRRVFRSAGFVEVMQQVCQSNWDGRLYEFTQNRPDEVMLCRFREGVLADESLVQEIRSLSRDIGDIRDEVNGKLLRKRRNQLIGRLRRELATCSASALAADGVVIVDEFQRFANLLDARRRDEDPAVHLAEQLLQSSQTGRRVLLLSATPYRIPGRELEPGEQPYDDFVALMRFLAGEEQAERLAAALTIFSRELSARPPVEAAVKKARDAAQAILRRVMSRTERTGATRDGMVSEDMRLLEPTTDELRGAIAARRIARRLRTRDAVEYWKSAPFFLEFMRDYQFRKAAVASSGKDKRFVLREARAGRLMLDLQAVRRMDPVDPPSARMRDLIASAMPEGVERLLWAPPSLPYSEARGAFASAPLDIKRLLFTEWQLAPDAISAMVSFEAERRLAAGMRLMRRRRKRSDRGLSLRHAQFGQLGDLLRLGRPARAGTDPTKAMAPLALLLPFAALADVGDPLAIAAERKSPISRAELVTLVRRRISVKLGNLGRHRRGRVDERWYWAAPILLEDPDVVRTWLDTDEQLTAPELTALASAIRSVLDEPEQLGRRPRNLSEVLARVAIGAPGVSALRAITRTVADGIEDSALRAASLRVARGFQSLFNLGDAAMAVQLHCLAPKLSYWRQVLEYCVDGNLQSVLDEQMHLIADALALYEGTPDEKLSKAVSTIHGCITLRRASVEANNLERGSRSGGSREKLVRLRCRHGLRFAEIKDVDGAVSRLDAVRDAFNSPFRPFVLASTTVGQEGLDFHGWCHAVVHWNLPRSPVDLEQREGRVLRYKGHAVRLNLARGIGLSGLPLGFEPARSDPWAAMFGVASKRDHGNPLAPFWVYDDVTNPISVRRVLPILTCSREYEALPRLRERLATYRLVLGLPRQEDLLGTLERNGVTAEQAWNWRIDLSPPPTPR
ncbi:hypothetical protein E2493_09400 [Sphingomonas parva]|uniref:Helicase C-terminal domain-containing protein n=1 Tax=Sphingomonas parva TaxID=2555898 RepID=A0A4Y8ZRR7_9SPHN|nr:helicase-related protein [Sphingomonas parva]TFI58624.1 hypothetical protein E2493_09400 [Sphingomonas parva]